jgi:hypothetical protein
MVISVYVVNTCMSVWTRVRAPYCKGGGGYGRTIAIATWGNKYLTGRWVQLGAECLFLSHTQTLVK